MADCRSCRFFVPADRLPAGARDWCEDWVREFRPGEEVLGYCKARKRPVTYFEGKCRFFKRRYFRQRTLAGEVIE